jgi:hypothetical protein
MFLGLINKLVARNARPEMNLRHGAFCRVRARATSVGGPGGGAGGVFVAWFAPLFFCSPCERCIFAGWALTMMMIPLNGLDCSFIQ